MTILGYDHDFATGSQPSWREEMREQNAIDARWTQRLRLERKEKLRAHGRVWLAEIERVRRIERRWGWFLRPWRRLQRSLWRRANALVPRELPEQLG